MKKTLLKMINLFVIYFPRNKLNPQKIITTKFALLISACLSN